MALRLAKISLDEQRKIADAITDELRRTASEYRIDEWSVHQALVKMNLLLTEYQSAGTSGAYFHPDEVGSVMPVLLASGSPHTRTRAIAHEIAHHLMRDWVAESIYRTDTVICTEQDGPQTRHAIARMVEKDF